MIEEYKTMPELDNVPDDPPPKFKIISASLAPNLVDKMNNLAECLKISRSELIKRAVLEFIARDEGNV